MSDASRRSRGGDGSAGSNWLWTCCLALVLVAGALLILPAELGARLQHGRWLPLDLTIALSVIWHWLMNLRAPMSGWPAGDRALLPSLGLYELLALLELVLAVAAAVFGLRAWARRSDGGKDRKRGLVQTAMMRNRGRQAPRDLRPAPNVFLGWERSGLGGWRAVRANTGECVGVVGISGQGKTSGQHMPAVVSFSGAVVSTTTKPDVLEATASIRAAQGSPCWALLPGGELEEPLPEGVAEARIDLMPSLRDQERCQVLVHGLAQSARRAAGGRSAGEGEFFARSGQAIAAELLQAAALGGLTVWDVVGWAEQMNAEPAIEIMAEKLPVLVGGPGSQLRALQRGAEVTVRGQWANAQDVLAPFTRPLARRLLSEPNFAVDRFLREKGTLYVIDQLAEQGRSPMADVVACFLDWIKERAYEAARSRGRDARHDPVLLLAIDELANGCPLKTLPGILSQGPGRGVYVSWATQNFVQLEDVFGESDSVRQATHNLILLGGGGDDRSGTLDRVLQGLGKTEHWEKRQSGAEHRIERRVLEVSDVVRQEPGEAFLVTRGRAAKLWLPPAPRVRPYQRLAKQLAA